MPPLGLTKQQYRVCLLRFGHDKTNEQIARKLRITRQAVEQHLSAAARKYPALARQLGKKSRSGPSPSPREFGGGGHEFKSTAAA